MVVNIPKDSSTFYRNQVLCFAREVLKKFDENDRERFVNEVNSFGRIYTRKQGK